VGEHCFAEGWRNPGEAGKFSAMSEKQRFKSEEDTPRDQHQALSRDTGGVEDPSAVDQASTTGTTPKGEYVGRIAGDDVGAGEETGAERRAEVAEKAGDVPNAPGTAATAGTAAESRD
jgi:hypothetical protein